MNSNTDVFGNMLAVFFLCFEDEIRNKRVLVTGGSGGIGEQIAYHYARLGANVLITARREAELRRVVAKMADISPAGTAHAYIVADMSVMTDTLRIIEVSVDAEQVKAKEILYITLICTSSLSYYNYLKSIILI